MSFSHNISLSDTICLIQFILFLHFLELFLLSGIVSVQLACSILRFLSTLLFYVCDRHHNLIGLGICIKSAEKFVELHIGGTTNKNVYNSQKIEILKRDLPKWNQSHFDLSLLMIKNTFQVKACFDKCYLESTSRQMIEKVYKKVMEMFKKESLSMNKGEYYQKVVISLAILQTFQPIYLSYDVFFFNLLFNSFRFVKLQSI